MNGIYLWYKPSGNDDKTDIDLHFNLWKLRKNTFSFFKEFDRFIDIGIWMKNAHEVDSLFLYLPFKYEKTDIIDLSEKIVGKDDFLRVVFNENYHSKDSKGAYTEIKDENDKEVFFFYKIESFKEVELDDKPGTLIKIGLSAKDKRKQNTYIRFRLKNLAERLVDINKPTNTFFQSFYIRDEIIDFRVNELRALDAHISEKKDGDLEFKKVNFFYLCNSTEEITFSQPDFKRCRNLEHEVWNDYLDFNDSSTVKGSILAYHWQAKECVDFNLLLKTKYEYTSVWIKTIYIISALLMALCFNLLSNWLYDAYFNSSSSANSYEVDLKREGDSLCNRYEMHIIND